MMVRLSDLYLWTQDDYDQLMRQLASLQASLAGLRHEQRIAALGLQHATDRFAAMEEQHMSALDDLTAQVQANTNLEQSAVQAIQGIAKQLQDALTNNDSAALTALAQQLNASAAALGTAITANTPQVNPLSQSQHP